MRVIPQADVTELVNRLCYEASLRLPADVLDALHRARRAETSERGRWVLDQVLENAELASREGLPLCQDTGLVFCFLRLGREATVDGDLQAAVDEGVRRAYTNNPLRRSVLADPLRRDSNTGDDTPALMYLELVPGDGLEVTVAAKGGGSENAGALWMLTPAAGEKEISALVVRQIRLQGGKWCPPGVVGLGIGGSMDRAALLAKKALLRPVASSNPDPRYADLEARLLAAVNATGVGPMGLGGSVTALAVHIEWAPCHIASLPVAMALDCHAARHAVGQL